MTRNEIDQNMAIYQSIEVFGSMYCKPNKRIMTTYNELVRSMNEVVIYDRVITDRECDIRS